MRIGGYDAKDHISHAATSSGSRKINIVTVRAVTRPGERNGAEIRKKVFRRRRDSGQN